MSTPKNTSRIFSALFTALFLLTGVLGIRGVASTPNTADRSNDLLQFTAGGHALGFTSDGMYAATGSHVLRVDFMDANSVRPQADSSASLNEKAAPLSRVSYADLWEGTTLVYTSSVGNIYSTTYQLEAGADAEDIRLRYNAPLSLNQNGTLNIAFENGTLTESAPVAWQEIQGRHVAVPVAFQVQGQEVGFTLGRYNASYPVTIDPTLTWNTFLGSSAQDRGNSIAVDGSGNVYVAGESKGTWGLPIRAYSLGDDAFVAKLNATTGNLIWNTFLGGSLGDFGSGIALDGSGNIYISGSSFATWGSPVRAYTAGQDAFVAKLDNDGALQWNTFLGGSSVDQGYSLDTDGSNVYIAGTSQGTWGTPVQSFNTSGEAFAAKLDASTGSLTWNTFMGGSGFDDGRGITVDGSGNVYIIGLSPSTWGTPVRVYTADYDTFIAKLDSNGTLSWSTFLGGDNGDYGESIAFGGGNVYVTGESNATWGSPIRAYGGGVSDAFVAKLDTSTGGLTWNTFLGGSGAEYGSSITLDGSENVYVIGFSNANWGSPIQAYNGSGDAFIALLKPSGSLAWNTFVGGSTSNDDGFGIAVDSDKNIYVTGESDISWGTPVRAYTANQLDAFVARLFNSPIVTSIVRANPSPTSAASVNFTVTFSEAVDGVTLDDFSLTTTGTISGAALTGGSGGGTAFTITVNTGTGSGTIRLDLDDNDSIVSLATSNPLGGAGAGNGDFITGQAYIKTQTLILRSVGVNDGWILESTETSGAGGTLNNAATTFNLGDAIADKQYRAILHFDTSTLPDTAIITSAIFKIKKQGLAGTDPFTILGALRADMLKPAFGAATLELADFKSAAGKNNVATFGVTPVSNFYSAIVNNTGRVYINRTGTTQVRLRFLTDDNDDNGNDFMKFYSGNAGAANRPQLVVEYYVP